MRRTLASSRGEHRVEEAREARVEVIAAQRDDALRAARLGERHPRLAQDAEVVGERRLRDGDLEGPARALTLGGERADDVQPDGVAERVEDGGQFEGGGGRVDELGGGHGETYCTRSVEHCVRCSSNVEGRIPAVPSTPTSETPQPVRIRRLVVFTGKLSRRA